MLGQRRSVFHAFRTTERKNVAREFVRFFLIAVVTAFLNIFAYVFLDKLRIFLRVPLEVWGNMREYLFVIFIGIPAVGVVGIWWSVPIGWILADLAGLLYYKNKRKRLLSFL